MSGTEIIGFTLFVLLAMAIVLMLLNTIPDIAREWWRLMDEHTERKRERESEKRRVMFK